jgi:predicted ATP-binding protein involved in virulence
MGYASGDPYCMRHFSDSLRTLIEKYFLADTKIFPHAKWLKAGLKRKVNESIYVNAELTLASDGMRKRVMLSPNASGSALPYNAWSAGQREFTPLLLALYWLMPSARLLRRDALKIVVIEEPEMGLHPQAIVSFGLLVLELMARDYRVVISTHSPVVLDLVWAIRELKALSENAAIAALGKVFGVAGDAQVRTALKAALHKGYRTYFFERTSQGVVAKDISSLDPGAADADVSGWGGLSGFSGRTAEIVGDALAKEDA